MNDKSNEAKHIENISINFMQEPSTEVNALLEEIYSGKTSKNLTISNSMQEPSAEVRAKINELLADDPRLKYPYMSRHEYRKMMEEREK